MDKVLALIRRTDTAFYLTGGTALGRHYLHHRYSDDLDLFVNAAGVSRGAAGDVEMGATLRSGRLCLRSESDASGYLSWPR